MFMHVSVPGWEEKFLLLGWGRNVRRGGENLGPSQSNLMDPFVKVFLFHDLLLITLSFLQSFVRGTLFLWKHKCYWFGWVIYYSSSFFNTLQFCLVLISFLSLNFIVELSEVNFISKLLKIAHYVLMYNLH